MLPEDKRQQLDGIVSQMTANRESDDAINFVVNDFKNKYSVEEPDEPFTERAAKVLDTIFGGGKIGEAIGTAIAKSRATPEEREFITGPTKGQVLGSALQSASLFAPVGTAAKGITLGARAVGVSRGASALGKIGAGALTGELFDIATNLQQGKTGKEALTPGFGTLLGGGIPALGVAKNSIVRIKEGYAPRVINSLIKPLAKDFSYGKNPGRAVAEEGIIAGDFDELINGIRNKKQEIGREIGEISKQLSTRPMISITDALSPLDEAIKTAASQNNQGVVSRLNNIRRALTEVLEPVSDDAGNIAIRSVGGRDLENLTFGQVRNILGDVGDLTAFTGNPSDDKLVNSALKKVYGNIKQKSLNLARELNPELAKRFEQVTEKYADLQSAEIAAKYRDKIVERQALIGLTPVTAGIGSALITAVATGGATIPIALAGVSGALIDKLASTPAFKTRLAYILSKKSPKEANYLFRKIPALSKFFSTKDGVFPGDIVLGGKAEGVEKGIAGYIKNPKLGLSVEDVSKREFKNFNDLSSKLLSKLEGRTTVSKQFISDLTNSPDLKQAERDLFRELLKGEGDNINVSQFANKVKSELLPLEVRRGKGDTYSDNVKFESIVLPDELRGPVANYDERIYNSPIKTSAGDVHFGGKQSDNYFAHTRIEDLADAPKSGKTYDEIQTMLDDFEKYPAGSKKRAELRKLQETANDYQHGDTSAGASTRRVIEIQSDLFQKGRLENEGLTKADATPTALLEHASDSQKKEWLAFREKNMQNGLSDAEKKRWGELGDELYETARAASRTEIAKLEPYRNTWHERIIREEIKKAAQDGKTKLQFPTGETAMKIEGLGTQTSWLPGDYVANNRNYPPVAGGHNIKSEQLKVGMDIKQGYGGDNWIITDVLGDGKFKAVPKDYLERFSQQISKEKTPNEYYELIGMNAKDAKEAIARRTETFDISGKVDTNNPIYKFYEKEVGRYLKNKYNAELITDAQGVKWWEVKVDKKMGKLPIEAFGVAPLLLQDEE